jgi:predicted dehydrogenase
MTDAAISAGAPAMVTSTRAVRLAFVGVGWIGGHRLERVLAHDVADVVAVVDVQRSMAMAVAETVLGTPSRRAPRALPAVFGGIQEMLAQVSSLELDGVVIATPSALHATQVIAALQAGCAVYCQKPLSRTGVEARAIVQAARRANRLLNVDFCYRGVAGMDQARTLIQNGELGTLVAVDLVFHNAFGPDRPWFFDRALSGGGCVMDLGYHLVDLLHWMLPDNAVTHVHAQRFAKGAQLMPFDETVEDYALATLSLSSGATARLACSWQSHVGADAVIGATFTGTGGSVQLHNRGGSATDLSVEYLEGTARRLLEFPDEHWDGVEIMRWVDALSNGAGLDEDACDGFIAVADVIDRINGQ